VELINHLMLGEPETTIGIKYESTLDGRQAAVHERSHVAGSGDPRRTAKASPEAASSASRPGETSKHVSLKDAIHNLAELKPKSSRGGPGDKEEVHVSEEELGVTQNDAVGGDDD
jgi:hypothetical protein